LGNVIGWISRKLNSTDGSFIARLMLESQV
jgi:hypothetical protein